MSRFCIESLAAVHQPDSPSPPASVSAEQRVARAAVSLLRGDVAVLRRGTRFVMAAADGVEAGESARRLADPLDAMTLGYRSQISVPLWCEGRRVGTLAVLGRRQRRFDGADIAMLRALAGTVDQHLSSVH